MSDRERTTVRGSFEVKLSPHADGGSAHGLQRLGLDKQFSGDLEATSVGEMMSAMTDVKGSAGYVALERVTGTLQGRAGSFVLQHYGLMHRGAPELMVRVVPDSGTDGLTGLSGSMTIDVAPGKHSYSFEFWFEAES